MLYSIMLGHETRGTVAPHIKGDTAHVLGFDTRTQQLCPVDKRQALDNTAAYLKLG